MNLVKKCIAEAIGTFAIVFAGCGAIVVNQAKDGAIGHLGIAISFGLVVMVMIYALGHISGAHFNPAVTLAFSSSRNFPKKEILPYIISQCIGAIIGSLALKYSLTSMITETTNLGVTAGPSPGVIFIWEFILSFFLMLVIISVATDCRAVGANAGIAIGGTVALDALFGGPICGASMNPARSLGPALVAGDWQDFWLYVLAPILGTVSAALLYTFIRCDKPDDNSEVKGCC